MLGFIVLALARAATVMSSDMRYPDASASPARKSQFGLRFLKRLDDRQMCVNNSLVRIAAAD